MRQGLKKENEEGEIIGGTKVRLALRNPLICRCDPWSQFRLVSQRRGKGAGAGQGGRDEATLFKKKKEKSR